jgi:uncharacterized membrane protein YgcG
MELYIIGALALALIYLDSMAIYYAIKSDVFEPFQIIYQTLFVIFIPFVGALIILSFALSQIRSTVPNVAVQRTKSRFLELLFLSAVITSHSNNSGFSDNGGSGNDFGGFDGGGDGGDGGGGDG